METSQVAPITQAYRQTHERILKMAEQLTDEQLRTSPFPQGHTVNFHIWHVARWADHFQAAAPGMHPVLKERLGEGQQIWYAKQIAKQWGLDTSTLSYEETGMGMDDQLAKTLVWPEKTVLLEYVRQVFSAAARAVDAIDDQVFQALEQAQPMTDGLRSEGTTIGSALVVHLTHENRHLGMIECLCGFHLGSGTATV